MSDSMRHIGSDVSSSCESLHVRTDTHFALKVAHVRRNSLAARSPNAASSIEKSHKQQFHSRSPLLISLDVAVTEQTNSDSCLESAAGPLVHGGDAALLSHHALPVSFPQPVLFHQYDLSSDENDGRSVSPGTSDDGVSSRMAAENTQNFVDDAFQSPKSSNRVPTHSELCVDGTTPPHVVRPDVSPSKLRHEFDDDEVAPKGTCSAETAAQVVRPLDAQSTFALNRHPPASIGDVVTALPPRNEGEASVSTENSVSVFDSHSWSTSNPQVFPLQGIPLRPFHLNNNNNNNELSTSSELPDKVTQSQRSSITGNLPFRERIPSVTITGPDIQPKRKRDSDANRNFHFVPPKILIGSPAMSSLTVSSSATPLGNEKQVEVGNAELAQVLETPVETGESEKVANDSETAASAPSQDPTDPEQLHYRRMVTFLLRLVAAENNKSRLPPGDEHVDQRPVEHSLIDVHRVKRVIHAAKLNNAQRLKVIPLHAQKKKLVPIDICAKHFSTQVLLGDSDCEAIMTALEALSDAVVNSQESVLSMIEDRLAKVVSDNRAKFADNAFKKFWDSLHLATIFVFYVLSLQRNVIDLQYDATPEFGSGYLALFIIFTIFWAVDILFSTQVFAIDKDGRLVKDRYSIFLQRRTQIIIDALCCVPIDFIIEGANGSFPAFLFFRCCKYIKIFRVSYLYELVNRDVITPGIVVFHFQIKKVLTGICWLLLFMITLAMVLSLIDLYMIAPDNGRQYPSLYESFLAICIILSSSSANTVVFTTADKILYILLAILSMIGVGLIVGQLTSLVFTNSVTAENYQLMRDTLGIIEHYNVPRAIQREVLSFQMHALNDDVVRHMENLAQLPLQMQQEIMMYIKIDAIAKVKLFSGASKECQMVLASSLARVIVEPEVEIIRFGEVGTEMYMIAHGYADVILGNGKVVTTFTRGDCFGEMALVQRDSKRTATIRALTYCDMWTLDKDAFLEALAVYPDFLQTVEVELINRKGNVEELRQSVAAVHEELVLMGGKDRKPSNAEDENDNIDPAMSLRARERAKSVEVEERSPLDPPDAANFDVNADHGIPVHRAVSRMAPRRVSLDFNSPRGENVRRESIILRKLPRRTTGDLATHRGTFFGTVPGPQLGLPDATEVAEESLSTGPSEQNIALLQKIESLEKEIEAARMAMGNILQSAKESHAFSRRASVF